LQVNEKKNSAVHRHRVASAPERPLVLMPKEDSVIMHKSPYWIRTSACKEQQKLALAEY